MSRRSVTRSAIRPPMLVKMPTNWSTAACTDATRSVAAAQLLAHRAAQPLVAGQAGAGGQHLGRGAGRLGGLAAEAVGDGGDRVVVRRQGGLGVGEAAVAEARDRLGGHLAADQQGGPVGDAGDDGGAVQDGRRTWVCGGDHGHKLTLDPLDSQHIRA